MHLCKYCYANAEPTVIFKQNKLHDPESPFLIGNYLEGDKIHEVVQEQLVGVEQVDDRLMELLDERGKNKVTHRYVDFVSKEDSASRGVIPKRGDDNSSLPPKDQIRIPDSFRNRRKV